MPYCSKDFYDHRKKQLVSKKAAETATCPSCGGWQHVGKFDWNRATRPLCQRCGSVLEPSKRVQKLNPERKTKFKPAPKQRCCKTCQAVLRSSNASKLCAPCEREAWRKEHEGLS